MPGSLNLRSGGDTEVLLADKASVFGQRAFWLKSVEGQTHAFDGITNAIMPVGNSTNMMDATRIHYGPNAFNPANWVQTKTALGAQYALMNRDFTAECWVNVQDRWMWGGGCFGGTGWWIDIGNNNYNNSVWFSYNGVWDLWGGNGPYSPTALPVNQWHHVSVSRKKTRLYMHVDGVYKMGMDIPQTQFMNTGTDPTKDQIWVGSQDAHVFVEDAFLYVGKACRMESNFTPAPVSANTPAPLVYY